VVGWSPFGQCGRGRWRHRRQPRRGHPVGWRTA
jgi:hypothetical protein